jgi:hypothetical protein
MAQQHANARRPAAPRAVALILTAILLFAATALSDKETASAGGKADAGVKSYTGASCGAISGDFFANEVWPKVGAHSCLECHKAGGDAEDSRFVLVDPLLKPGQDAQEEAMKHNRE